MDGKLCVVCCKNKTSIKCEINRTDSGLPYREIIYVCERCLDDSIENFIFICINCRKIHKRDKNKAISKLLKSNSEDDIEFSRGLRIVAREKMIMGISSCISCNKDSILDNFLFDQNSGSC